MFYYWIVQLYNFMVKKVKLFLCLISEALCHEDIWESENVAAPFLISALSEGEWLASCPGHFIPVDKAPATYWVGG
jgi:hypothetical protein